MSELSGKISQIIGPVVDVQFEIPKSGEVKLPAINDAIYVSRNGHDIYLEVHQHIGENTVRTVAMDSTDGLRRGLPVKALGSSLSVPVGDQVKGRLLNVMGRPIDGLKPLSPTISIQFTVKYLNLTIVHIGGDAHNRNKGD